MVDTVDYPRSFQHLKFDPLVTMNMCTASDSNEQDGIASNGKMVAMAWSSQASVAVFNATK